MIFSDTRVIPESGAMSKPEHHQIGPKNKNNSKSLGICKRKLL